MPSWVEGRHLRPRCRGPHRGEHVGQLLVAQNAFFNEKPRERFQAHCGGEKQFFERLRSLGAGTRWFKGRPLGEFRAPIISSAALHPIIGGFDPAAVQAGTAFIFLLRVRCETAFECHGRASRIGGGLDSFLTNLV